MATFAVTYAYSDSTSAGRDTVRPAHVEFLKAQFDGGRLLKSGPFGPEESPGALLIIDGDTKADVEALMDQDPFHQAGLIEERTVRQWNIFFGADAAQPAAAQTAAQN
ncbi:YciI family protein [Paenarthrobacter sp. OM7]|uniref:YciI family protein n=1 Tax=Paenarthrobacter sp. AMU7 TaxID=3162492 RepID=A0AB39YLS5_9MICC|nr:YciI family protein [Paenarthrobacter sp. OM7]WGM19747.1 YciI family protein [Paenarthrobacter sp. OM7]